MGSLRHTKSFLGTPELLSTYKAYIHSLVEYCSPLWAGDPASHLAQLDAVEAKAFKIIGISRDEAESMSLSFHHRRQVGGRSVFHRLLPGLAPSVLSVLCPPQVPPGHTRSTINPLLVRLSKSRITAQLHLFVRSSFPVYGSTSSQISIFPFLRVCFCFHLVLHIPLLLSHTHYLCNSPSIVSFNPAVGAHLSLVFLLFCCILILSVLSLFHKS